MLPAVVDQIVWMIKEEVRRSGGDVHRAADQYIDTVVTNAVLNVRGRLDVRQRDTSKAFFVVSNDPSGGLNDNRSNSSWLQQARELSIKYADCQRQAKYSDEDDSDDDDDENDDDYDSDGCTSEPLYPFSDARLTRSESFSTTQRDKLTRYCSSMDEDRDGRSSKRDQTQDCRQDLGKHQMSTDFGDSSRLRADRTDKDDYRTTGPPSDRKQKPDHDRSGTFEDDDQQTCSCNCDAKTKFRDGGKQTCGCSCHAKTPLKDRQTYDSLCDKERKQSGRDCTKRGGTFVCGEQSTDKDGDIVRSLERRDDESIENYLIRSVLLLGILANESNSSAAGSWIAQAINETVESIQRAHSSGRAASQTYTEYYDRGDDSQSVHHSARQGVKIPITNRLRSPTPSHSRFASAAGSRNSGDRSAYPCARGGAACGRAAVSNSSSFSTMPSADNKREEGRSLRYSDWVNSQRMGRGTFLHTYRSNRTDRERFSMPHSRYCKTAAGNINAHSNRADDATSATGDTVQKHGNNSARVTAANATELNTNNSRPTVQDNNLSLIHI